MRVVGYTLSHTADHPDSLIDMEMPAPTPTGRDVLLVIGGTGGVNSTSVQLARATTDLTPNQFVAFMCNAPANCAGALHASKPYFPRYSG